MSQISVNHLTFYYEGSYDNIFEDVSFQIDTDWKLGFIGRNGKGKTTFLNLLLGKYEYQGSISSSVVVDYFPFEVKNSSASGTICDKGAILFFIFSQTDLQCSTGSYMVLGTSVDGF